ncbi:MAG TPA: prephenate dehydrogenase/arogenate dehydrogenase family protein [Ignavibacteria bacterium]|nr:prephenate dehydrogenase/arogenate dehydrogenase family protein [Ignavibacteria bacterium]
MQLPIKNISIIGLGLIGGSIAKALKQSAYNFEISAYDRTEVLSKAFKERTIDKQLTSLEESLNSDLIFICLPVELALEYLNKLAPELNENQIITDVSGVKGIFENQWNRLNSKGIYIGGHPMTGKELGGYDNSDPLLFENSVYILSDRQKDSPLFDEFIKVIEATGSRITLLDPFIHDKVVAYVSHLPQMLSVSLVNNSVINKDGISFSNFAAGGFRDMTRIASSDFSIWEKIIAYNKDEIIEAIKSMKDELNKMEELIKDDNYNILAEIFEKARIKRDEIPKDTKGFLTQLYDLFVFVTDQPGVISRISTALFNNNINIKDIELLKIREGTGGTFRLSFESEVDVIKAGEIITKEGFEIK